VIRRGKAREKEIEKEERVKGGFQVFRTLQSFKMRKDTRGTWKNFEGMKGSPKGLRKFQHGKQGLKELRKNLKNQK
jgi:hypothetical protein